MYSLTCWQLHFVEAKSYVLSTIILPYIYCVFSHVSFSSFRISGIILVLPLYNFKSMLRIQNLIFLGQFVTCIGVSHLHSYEHCALTSFG